MVRDKINKATINENIVSHHCLVITGLSTSMCLLSLRYTIYPHRIDIILLHSLIVHCLVGLGRASNHQEVLSATAAGLLQSYNSSPSKMNKLRVAWMSSS